MSGLGPDFTVLGFRVPLWSRVPITMCLAVVSRLLLPCIKGKLEGGGDSPEKVPAWLCIFPAAGFGVCLRCFFSGPMG